MSNDIVGRKITGVRMMTAEEYDAEGWSVPTVVIELDKGAMLLYASQDEEGNGPGSMFGRRGDTHLVVRI